MNIFFRCLVCVAMLTMPVSRTLAADVFLLVRTTDMLRASSYQVMSPDEFKQLQKQLQLEERSFPKALAEAKDEWAKDEMNKTSPFPVARIVPRKLVGQPEKFPTTEKAEERLAQYEDRESLKRQREADKEEKKPQNAAAKAKADRDMDKEILAGRAAELVAAKLSALTGMEIVTADPFAGKKDEAKAAEVKKADEKPAAGKKKDKEKAAKEE